ncbi:MAG: DMT family transporter [Pseudomonadota bacterium]
MRATAYLVLAASLFLWAGNWVVARGVRDDISPAIATFSRQLIVVALLLPFIFGSLFRKLKSIERKGWTTLAFLALFGGGVHLTLQWLGLHTTTATSGTLYLSISPIFILLLAGPLLGEPIGARQWIGVGVSFVGVFFIATQGNPASLSFNVGDVLALLSMLMWGAYTVFLRLRSDPLDTPEFLVVLCLLGILWNAPWVGFEIAQGLQPRLGAVGAGAVAYSAVGSMLLAYAGWNYAVSRLGAARAGVTMHLTPAFGVLLAALFLAEYPAWYHFAGIALIVAGVALSSARASSAASSR